MVKSSNLFSDKCILAPSIAPPIMGGAGGDYSKGRCQKGDWVCLLNTWLIAMGVQVSLSPRKC